MENKIAKIIKRTRSSNKRLIFVVLGHESLKKVPDFYKIVSREKPLKINWLSSDSADTRKINWTCKTNDDDIKKQNENAMPKVTHVLLSNIENASLQSSYFTVVQELESIKPADLVKILESVPGKGVLVFLFSNITKMEKLTSPEKCDLVKSRFIKRLFASFTTCCSCVILNDKLDILFVSKTEPENRSMIEEDTCESSTILQKESEHYEIFYNLIKICSTKDQSQFLSECLEILKRRSSHCTISASSPKGRGKSAVLGLAIAGAIALKYSNIFISSLNYVNVKAIFKYLLMGLDAIDFKEDKDYDLIQSVNPKFNNVLLGLNIFRDHPQAVRFIYPADVENKLEQAELVVIDEAAAMPLPLLKKLLGPYIIFMTSTTESYDGCGKYLYKDMLSEIRRSSSLRSTDRDISQEFPTSETVSWKEITLSEPVNYANGDEVENWIKDTLCLNCIPSKPNCAYPPDCNLFYVCQKTLFSYEPHAEKFLQQLMSLFFSTKRNISPDILLKIADDDNYHIFCLLPPSNSSKKGSTDILCAVLVHTEKYIPSNIMYSGINLTKNLTGCFNEWVSDDDESEDFLMMQGIHIIDIVTYPIYKKMGYGSRALQLLQDFYEGKFISLDDKPYVYSCKSKQITTDNSQSWPPLLLQLSEVETEKANYFLVSYNLTPDLLRFWKKAEFVPVFISREKNFAQEHLCFMMKGISDEISACMKGSWISFRQEYFIYLRSYMKDFSAELALNLLNSKFNRQLPNKELTKEHIDIYLKPQRMKALEKYCQNLGDLHCVMPCIPILAKLFFSGRFIGVEMPIAQQVILLAFGLQHKTIEEISADLSLQTSQIHGLLNRTIRKLTTYLTNIIEKAVEKTMAVRDVTMEPVSESLDEELEEAALKIKEKQKEDLKKLLEMDFSQFAIKGSHDDWEKALHSGRKTLVSIKSIRKPPEDIEVPNQEKNKSFKHKRKVNKKR